MTIGQVARRLGVRPSALRYYERIGLLPPIERVNGQRRYGPAILSRLTVIDVAKQAGFTMREIRVLLSGFSPAGMKRLLQEGLRCRCVRLESCALAVRHAGAQRDGRLPGTVRTSRRPPRR